MVIEFPKRDEEEYDEELGRLPAGCGTVSLNYFNGDLVSLGLMPVVEAARLGFDAQEDGGLEYGREFLIEDPEGRVRFLKCVGMRVQIANDAASGGGSLQDSSDSGNAASCGQEKRVGQVHRIFATSGPVVDGEGFRLHVLV